MNLLYVALVAIAVYFLMFPRKSSEEGFSAALGCGAGKQTRTVQCRRSDNTIVTGDELKKCGLMPDVSQPCSDYSKCGYAWETGAWSTCT